MKLTLVLLSIVSLALVQCRIQRLPLIEVPFFAVTYIYIQASFTFFAAIIGLSVGWGGRAYEKFFYFCLALTLVAAVILAFNLLKPVSWMGFSLIIFLSLMLSVGVPWLSIDALGLKVTVLLLKQVSMCSIFMFCGSAALFSLFYPGGRVNDMVRLFLGVFWLSVAGYGFFCSMATVRHRNVWIYQTEMVPTMLAIILFSSLAWQLGKGQIELSRQPAISFFPLTEECMQIQCRSVNAKEYSAYSQRSIR